MTPPVLTATLLAGVVLAGCATGRAVKAPPPAGPDYARPLPTGASALRRVHDPERLPDLAAAYRNADALLVEAIDQSLDRWFSAPSSRQFFPFEGISHGRAQASLRALRDLLESRPGESVFVDEVKRRFEIYESVGCDGRGTVLFTGYYAPIFEASRQRSERFAHPLYRRPADLATDPLTGAPLGRRLPNGRTVPYDTRRRIETSQMLAGQELVWLDDPLSVYLVHVNGSARLKLTDGTTMHVGYAGKTDRPYTSLGREMIKAGLLGPDAVSLAAIRRVYRRGPRRVIDLMHRNENYVFFTEYNGGDWPAGSLGVRVTPERSLATDKTIYPRGGLVLVDTEAVSFSGGRRTFRHFMLDQDTGGALAAPGRADIFMGIGPSAEILAGGQHAEGRLYYLFLKPQFVAE